MGLITPLDRYYECGHEGNEDSATCDRCEMAANLRALANMIETEGMPQAHYARPRIDIYTEDIADARLAMALSPGGWEKVNTEDSYYVTYRKTFGTGAYRRNATSYEIFVSKEATCKRVEVGTRHVEATEAHDEIVYGWDCSGMPSTE